MLERDIHGLLIDLDGVIYDDEVVIPDSVYAIQWLQKQKVPFRFATNATARSRRSLVSRLAELGVEVTAEQVINTPFVAAQILRKRKGARCMLLVKEDARSDFEGIQLVDRDPDVVVVGDLANGFDYSTLNRAFQALLGGAELMALQKDRFWRVGDELVLDAGPFVAALEYASGRDAKLVGKPSPEFFQVALEGLDIGSQNMGMVGDDIENDVSGAQRAGMVGILVKTGKYNREWVERSGVVPDLVVKNLGELVSNF